MKFYGIDCQGKFNTQRLSTLSPHISGDEGRIVYDQERQKLWYGSNNEWKSFSDFGTVVTDFTNGDILFPDHIYHIDTTSSPLSGNLYNNAKNGDVVTVLDIAGTFSINTFTVATSGDLILQDTFFECDTSNQIIQFIYSEIYGWKVDIGGLSTGDSGGTLSQIEITPNDMLFDDEHNGIKNNALWGIIPCVDFSFSETGAIWTTLKAPSRFDYNKSIKVKLIYNNNINNTGNINLNGKIWIINEDNTGEHINELEPDISTNDILPVTEFNKLSETTLTYYTIGGGTSLSPFYFSFYLERTINVNDTYDGDFQLVSIILYQD